MELISLYYFSEVAKDLHITRTADRLYVTQQTLSNHIARLEDYYGMPLFYRRPKLSLTTAGERACLREQRRARARELDGLAVRH